MNNITTLPVDCFTCVNMRNTLRTAHFSRVLTSSLLIPVSADGLLIRHVGGFQTWTRRSESLISIGDLGNH